MGIQGLLPFLKKSSRPCNLSEFKGKTAAIDAYCWLHKGAFSCADKLVKGEPTDGYILYVMKQVNLLLSFNIKPILVFDGCHLPSKAGTEQKRRENRAKNRKKAKELLREGKVKEARECFQRCVDVTSKMAHDVIKACRNINVDTIVAPYEADAQLAFLSQCGIADIVITEDSDLILFGCDKIIFKVDGNGGGCLVEKEKLYLSMSVSRDKYSFEKFRNMCILSGCDYLPSLHGIGLVKACRFFLVTSNPDVFTALCKIPSNLKMPNLNVTLEYREGFMRAINTILYQLVFDPVNFILRPLNTYPPNLDHSDMPYCGEFMGHEKALQIALGNVDVQTGEIVDQYMPSTVTKSVTKSCSWQRNGESRSRFPSIWDSTKFFDWKENLLRKSIEAQRKERAKSTLGKERPVVFQLAKRKRQEQTAEESEVVSEKYLESIYSNDKLKKRLKLNDEDSEEVVKYETFEEDIKEDGNNRKHSLQMEGGLKKGDLNYEKLEDDLRNEQDLNYEKLEDDLRNEQDLNYEKLEDDLKKEGDLNSERLEDDLKKEGDLNSERYEDDLKKEGDLNSERYEDDLKKEGDLNSKNIIKGIVTQNDSSEESFDLGDKCQNVKINPFVKKSSSPILGTNKKVGYSFMKIVHSKYFVSAQTSKVNSAKEISSDKSVIKSPNVFENQLVKAEENCKNIKDDITDSAEKKGQPLKDKNSPNSSPSNHIISDRNNQSYTKNHLNDPDSQEDDILKSIKSIFDTPPPSQNKENFIEKLISSENTNVEENSRPTNPFNKNTSVKPTFQSFFRFKSLGNKSFSQGENSSNRISHSDVSSPEVKKCRVSGLRKTPNTKNEKQLSLKDMFAFKRDNDATMKL